MQNAAIPIVQVFKVRECAPQTSSTWFAMACSTLIRFGLLLLPCFEGVHAFQLFERSVFFMESVSALELERATASHIVP
ncbi:hypothetical protein EDB86DRAFT_3085224 [Lactarius hatsudake]|nr:hypothetical protein EDB86DRAFT_3085224 [Lactarius hatsudake]